MSSAEWHVRKTASGTACSKDSNLFPRHISPIQPLMHPYNHLCTHTTTDAPIQPLMHPHNNWCTHTTTYAPIQPLMHPYNPRCIFTAVHGLLEYANIKASVVVWVFMGSWNMQTYLVSNPFWAGDGRLCGKFPPYCVFETPAFIDVLLSSSLKVASFKSGNFDPRKVTRVLRNPRVLWLYPNIYTVAS